MDELFYAELADFQDNPRYSEREQLALEYAERFALDHLEIDDAFLRRLLTLFSSAEILDLSVVIARHLGFGRLTRVLQVDIVCAVHPAAG
jgi:alkylhydroperoxidase family enzyme